MQISVAALAATVLLGALSHEPAFGQESPLSEPAAALETAPEQIVITGQRPGPGLWKVSKGENVVYIFATYGPLPKDLEWRSQQVETILAQSQELIRPARAHFEPSFFQIIGLLPHLIGVEKNPDGSLLRERVSPEAYERWLLLKKKYLGDNQEVEKMRPYFAANRLYLAALRNIGLTGWTQVDQRIRAIATQHKLKMTAPVHKLEVDSPGALLKRFKKQPLDDAACFTTTLQRLDSDVDAMRVRANAWARSDLETLRKVQLADRRRDCDGAVMGVAPKELLPSDDMDARLDSLWLDAVKKALETNKSTFAMHPLRGLVEPDTLLAALREQGYTVESPE
jgi:uncharacterized protein YbaP (TraB family)